MTAFPKRCSMGRLDELRALSGAECVGITTPERLGDDYAVRVFASRAALKAFAKDGSRMHALVKDAVSPNMLTNRNMQRPVH